MKIDIEPLDSVDKEKIYDLFETIFPEPDKHWNIQKDVDESLKDVVEDCSAVAWKEDRPIGAILTIVKEDGLNIEHIGVLQNHRRMGIGRMLLRHAVENTDESVTSRIPKDNHPIIELMEEEGFVREKEEEDYYLYKFDQD